MTVPIQVAITANGSTKWMRTAGDSSWFGVMGGTWGGGTLTLQTKVGNSVVTVMDGSTSIAYSADFFDKFDLGKNYLFRWTLSGATSPSIIIEGAGFEIRDIDN